MIRIECNGDVSIALDWKKKEREEGLEVICGRRICSQFRDENFFAEIFFWCKKVNTLEYCRFMWKISC